MKIRNVSIGKQNKSRRIEFTFEIDVVAVHFSTDIFYFVYLIVTKAEFIQSARVHGNLQTMADQRSNCGINSVHGTIFFCGNRWLLRGYRNSPGKTYAIKYWRFFKPIKFIADFLAKDKIHVCEIEHGQNVPGALFFIVLGCCLCAPIYICLRIPLSCFFCHTYHLISKHWTFFLSRIQF